ncbi:hypothetical protein [Thermocrispum municipale]|uniref:hypothetical protein n=1 Tax=Thermocrispum municipale TaxID=37926 RepID=UPI001FDEA828|nr:hypothetical protein [Thermocrispum municipale]
MSARPNPTTALSRAAGNGSAARHPQARTARLLFLLALVVVAALSSVVWWSIRGTGSNSPAAQTGTQQSPSRTADDNGGDSARPPVLRAGAFNYHGLAPLQTDQRCDKVSYGKVRAWLAKEPCQEVVRGLFSVRDGDARAAVSVVVVTMPSPEQAEELKSMTDTDGTGNIADLVTDGTVSLPDVPKVAGGEYASSVDGPRVTIVEAAFFADTQNNALLDEIATQALQLGPQMISGR